MKKTKKYYRDKINRSFADACEVLPEILMKYGNVTGRMKRMLPADSSYLSNYKVDGFTIDHGRISVKIYWQGDDTDGTESVTLEQACAFYVIPAQTMWDGYRTREIHGDIHIHPNKVYEAIQFIATNYLS